MTNRDTLAEEHSLSREALFRFKSTGLTALRSLRNIFDGARRFRFATSLADETVISESRTDLWNKDDNQSNWILTAGKVQNLRTAARKLNGLEVPANQIFSFWKHIGNPVKRRGYVIGREIREGCIVPTIAGGLCQLSNALYDAALKAGFEIIERHRHSKVIKGSLAELDRDATVKWNYIDLRFKSFYPFRIEVEISNDELLVTFKGKANGLSTEDKPIKKITTSTLNDCYSCGNFECFKHPDKAVTKTGRAVTTFILDERWPEYEEYLKNVKIPGDHFIVPAFPGRFIKFRRFLWMSITRKNAVAVPWATLIRSFMIRLSAKRGKNVFEAMIRADRKVARAMARKIPIESTHLIISQNLLPFLWMESALGGRSFDVLMTRLPMEILHRYLDNAHTRYPESKTLNDFRASADLIAAENIALTKARKIISPHTQITALFSNKCIDLPWILPSVQNSASKNGNKILFPASSLGRKGAYEMRRLAMELNLSIVVAGDATEHDKFWDGIVIEKASPNPLHDVKLVVYPTYVEHQPRLLLRAIAQGIPVLTTTATGLPQGPGVTILQPGDYEGLRNAVSEAMYRVEHA